MRFLADENVPNSIKKIITDSGYDLLDVKKAKLAGSSDMKLWKLARRDDV
jgi:predicted nuclease of predicted toxin-antitoxin system